MIIALTTDRFFADLCYKIFPKGEVIEARSFDAISGRFNFSRSDVCIVDIQYLEPFDLTQIDCGVMVVTGVPKFSEAMQLLRFGIRGYGNRMMLPANLKQAVKSIESGQVWMPPDILGRILSAIPAEISEKPDEKLTERELEVAALVAKGMTNKEIAEKTGVTVRTVKAHLTSIFSKTGVRDRVALALKFK